jgi:hypothetical protein
VTGVVDEGVQTAELVRQGPYRRRPALGPFEVEPAQRTAAPERLDLPGRLLCALLLLVPGEADIEAHPCEGDRTRPPDAAVAAGDERDAHCHPPRGWE